MTFRALPLPSVEVLRHRLSYDPETGVFRWKFRDDAIPMWNTRYADKEAGYLSSYDGYVRFAIDGVDFAAHRVAFKMMTGREPVMEIDHRNGRRHDNRWSNLREATPAQNRRNQRPKDRGGRLPKGVYRPANRKRYVAQIKVDRKVIYLGSFATPEAAHAAYVEASRKLHGAFGRVA